MTVRQALIFAFLLSDVALYLVLRAWRADHASDEQPAKPRTTIYDAPPVEDER